jgi:hypothetical protein
MTYTIKIHQTESDLAKRLLWYLKSLAQTNEYGFLEIVEDDSDILSKDLTDELDRRFEHFLEHHDEYPEWEEVKKKFEPK